MPNIFDFSRLYRRVKTAEGLTASVVRLALKPIKPKTLRVLTHVTVEDLTTAFTKVRLGIIASGRYYYLDESTTVAQNELIVSRTDLLLLEGDVFFAEFTGTTTGDNLEMTCFGWTNTLP